MNKIALKPDAMPRRPLTFKKTDITRAAKAARDVGLEIASIEITKDGVRIAVVPGKPQEVVRLETEGNEWDSAV